MTIDDRTVAAYDRDPTSFADDWKAQPAPTDLQGMVQRFFRPGSTADIGCGSGRDTAWLNSHGYPATGFDASEGLIAEARRRDPGTSFVQATLPDLAGLGDACFANVLCETVIMHLPADAIGAAVVRLMAILEPGGTPYLSWRVTAQADVRDPAGRLYTVFDPELALGAHGAFEILYDRELESLSSARVTRRLLVRRST